MFGELVAGRVDEGVCSNSEQTRTAQLISAMRQFRLDTEVPVFPRTLQGLLQVFDVYQGTKLQLPRRLKSGEYAVGLSCLFAGSLTPVSALRLKRGERLSPLFALL